MTQAIRSADTAKRPIPGPAKIPLRIVNRRSDEDWWAETLNEWEHPFCLQCDPPVRLTWIRSAEASELLLVGHHCVCDGASLVTILRELLRATDQPPGWRDEGKPRWLRLPRSELC